MVVFQEGLDDAFGRATLESLYRDRIPPFLANLQCRWQEIITEYQKATGIQLPPRKLTVQDLLRMFADRPTTLVIVDQEGDGSVRLETTHTMLLKEMELRPGKPISPHIARREVTANRKLYDTPEVFFAGFRTTPVSFEGFIDPFSPDVYPDSMWSNFTAWLDGLKWQNAEISRFHGGRYGAAKEISRWELPFFHRRSLGEMIHIVQLALTSKDRGGRGLLSYQPDKTIAPCSFSEHQCDVEKNIRALLGINSLPHHVPPRYGQVLPYVGEGCASDAERWAELRDVLHAVLSHFPEGRSVALLKMEIERRCGLILDQRVFGKEKLSHVFESPELMEYFDMRREVQVGSNSKILIVRLKDVQPTQALKAAPTQALKAVYIPVHPTTTIQYMPIDESAPSNVDDDGQHPVDSGSPSMNPLAEEYVPSSPGLRTFEDPQTRCPPSQPLKAVEARPPTLVDHPNPTPSPSGDIASDTIVDVHTILSLASTKLGNGMSESEAVDMSFHCRAVQTSSSSSTRSSSGSALQIRNEEICQRNQALRESAMRSEMERQRIWIPSLSQESVSESTAKAQREYNKASTIYQESVTPKKHLTELPKEEASSQESVSESTAKAQREYNKGSTIYQESVTPKKHLTELPKEEALSQESVSESTAKAQREYNCSTIYQEPVTPKKHLTELLKEEAFRQLVGWHECVGSETFSRWGSHIDIADRPLCSATRITRMAWRLVRAGYLQNVQVNGTLWPEFSERPSVCKDFNSMLYST